MLTETELARRYATVDALLRDRNSNLCGMGQTKADDFFVSPAKARA